MYSIHKGRKNPFALSFASGYYLAVKQNRRYVVRFGNNY